MYSSGQDMPFAQFLRPRHGESCVSGASLSQLAIAWVVVISKRERPPSDSRRSVVQRKLL